MNWAVDDEERARRDRVRMKLFGAMLVGYGYAILAGSIWQPLANAEAIAASNYILAALGLAFHAIALYIAPKGEP